MILDYILLLKIFLISYTISRFEPIKFGLELLPDGLIWNTLRLALTCSKCLSFWVGWIMGGIYVGMIMSMFMTAFEIIYGTWERKIRF